MRGTDFFLVGATMGALAIGSPAHAKRPMSEEAQRRALLSQLAAAQSEVAPEERTDADLMYEAMKQWHGEPRGSEAVDRALAESKRDIKLDRKKIEEKVRQMFWRDPFSEEVVAVSKANRDLLSAHAKREARARQERQQEARDGREDEISRLRAENARLRGELQRAQESASSNETVAEGECAAPSRHVHARWNIGGGHAHHDPAMLEALNAPAREHVHHHGVKVRVEQVAAPVVTPAAETFTAQAPAGWRSNDPRGIIVVPIEASVRAH
jgi:hypothetical protein